MAEEKVGFAFEFGLKGDKEVKKGVEDIVRLLSNSGNAVQALGGLGKLVETAGGLAGPIGTAAVVMYELAMHSYEAGENLRKIRQDMVRLDRVPSGALSDSELSANTGEVVVHFQKLGLEAGNQFTTSFMTRLKNDWQGELATNWDIQAFIGNMFGANIPSYEATSPEAQDVLNRVSTNQKVETERIAQERRTSRAYKQAELTSASGISDIFSRKYGYLPESYLGQKGIRGLREGRASGELTAATNQVNFDEKRYLTLTGRDFLSQKQIGAGAPLQNIPGTTIPDLAGRQKDVYELESKIGGELSQQVEANQEILNLKLEQRNADRDWVRNQNYGMWRTLGLGGVGFHDAPHARGMGLNRISEALGGHHGRVSSAGLINHDYWASATHNGMKVQTETLQEINKRIAKIGTPTIQN